MKLRLFGLLLLLFGTSAHINAQEANPHYNKAYADSLGADEYGMKMYVLAILKTGPHTVTDSVARKQIFEGHMANINRLAKSGKLIVAGPFEKNDMAYRGIFIFNVSSLQEAKALVDTDPAVKAKVFDVALFQWYGSAALPEYLKVQPKIQKLKH